MSCKAEYLILVKCHTYGAVAGGPDESDVALLYLSEQPADTPLTAE